MENYNNPTNEETNAYDMAYKKVKKLKGFYTHLLVYIFVNIFIYVLNVNDLKPEESYFEWHNFTTLFFWGIGLTAHGLSVFMPYFVFGKNWEERKIKELMEKEKNHNWE